MSNNPNEIVLSDLDRQKIKKDIRNLKAKIRVRLKNIEKRFGSNAEPLSSYKKLDLASIKGANDAQLFHQRRVLEQFNKKQFTRVRGYKHYKEWYAEVNPKGLYSDSETEKRMWELYNKYVEENKIAEKYKYETLQIISEEIEDGSTEEEIHNRLNELYSYELGINKEAEIPFATKFKRRKR